MVGRELRQEFAGDARKSRQTRLAEDLCPDKGCDLRRDRNVLGVFCDIEVGRGFDGRRVERSSVPP